jgi:bifunctional DNase/RNase
MSIDIHRLAFFESFKAGKESVWIVVISQSAPNRMEPIVRKIDDFRLGLPVWIDRASAEKYLNETEGLPPCDVRSVSISELRDAITKFDEPIRHRIVLDLV